MILIASTIAAYKTENPEEAFSWLTHGEAWAEAGHEFFLAAELGHGRDDALAPVTERVKALGGSVWTFSLDTTEDRITSGGRLVRICTGRNFAHEVVNRRPLEFEGVLFVDTDVRPPADVIDRVLEVQRPLVGIDIPTYCLSGPSVQVQRDSHSKRWYSKVDGQPVTMFGDTRPYPQGADVREHWTSAGCLFVRTEAVRAMRWRYDFLTGSTDDPSFQADAARLGFGMTWVRHDVEARHVPEMIGPLEGRGADLRIR
jgi:hypothetical protein